MSNILQLDTSFNKKYLIFRIGDFALIRTTIANWLNIGNAFPLMCALLMASSLLYRRDQCLKGHEQLLLFVLTMLIWLCIVWFWLPDFSTCWDNFQWKVQSSVEGAVGQIINVVKSNITIPDKESKRSFRIDGFSGIAPSSFWMV